MKIVHEWAQLFFVHGKDFCIFLVEECLQLSLVDFFCLRCCIKVIRDRRRLGLLYSEAGSNSPPNQTLDRCDTFPRLVDKSCKRKKKKVG